jgi:hypothetical protein
MSVQGTQITKAGKDSVEMALREAKAQDLVEQAEDLAVTGERSTDGPALSSPKDLIAASELAEAARVLDPNISESEAYKRITGVVYEQQVMSALEQAVRGIMDPPLDRALAEIEDVKIGQIYDGVFDASIEAHYADGYEQIKVVIKRLNPNGLPTLKWLYRSVMAAVPAGDRVLVVCNRALGDRAYNRIMQWQPGLSVRLVKWDGPSDQNVLTRELKVLLQQSGKELARQYQAKG